MDKSGPAFPERNHVFVNCSSCGVPQEADVLSINSGMTLRDYFAAKAVEGLLASAPIRRETPAKDYAVNAYNVADAMLEAREVEGDG